MTRSPALTSRSRARPRGGSGSWKARLLGEPVPREQHQRQEAKARPDRRRRDLHQADADPGGLGGDPGPGRLQARYNRLVRRFGGDKNPAAKKKAITAIAHTLLKIAYQVLKTGTPYQEPGADTPTPAGTPLRSSRTTWNAECKSPTPAAPSPSPSARRRPPERPALNLTSGPHPCQAKEPPRPARRSFPPDKSAIASPRHRTGVGSLPRAHRGPSFRVRATGT